MCNKETQTDYTSDIPIYFNEEFIRDDSKVLHYTGLPNGELSQTIVIPKERILIINCDSDKLAFTKGVMKNAAVMILFFAVLH